MCVYICSSQPRERQYVYITRNLQKITNVNNAKICDGKNYMNTKITLKLLM